MTDQILRLESMCDLEIMARHLKDYLGHLRAKVQPIAESAIPLDAFEDHPDAAVAGSGAGLLGFGPWAVQEYLSTRNGGTLITLRAISEDTSSRVLSRSRSTISLASSVKKMDSLARLLRAMDAGTRMQRWDHA